MEKTFEFNGMQFEYPFSFIIASDAERSWYRREIINDYMQRKTENQLKNLPLREKIRRYSKNVGLELLASTLEALFCPLRLGGLTITFEEIREKKEITCWSYKSQEAKTF